MAQDVGIRNIDELRQFSGNLKDLGSQMSQISMEVKNIDALSQKMIEHATYLDRLCTIAEEYKSMR